MNDEVRRPRRAWRKVRARALALLAVGMLLGLPTTARAEQDPLAPVAERMRSILTRPVSHEEVEAGRNALARPDASTEDVEDYLRQAEAAGVLAEVLEPTIGGERFAGLRLDTTDLAIEISVPSAVPQSLDRRLTTVLPAVTVRRVSYPLQTLRHTHAAVAAAIPDLAADGIVVATIGESVPENRVVVEVEGALEPAQSQLRELLVDRYEHVIVRSGTRPSPAVCLERDACPANVTTPGTTIPGLIDERLRGGIQVTGGGFRCTSAFPARRTSDNRVALLTAGHCFSVGTNINHGLTGRIGSMSRSVFGGSATRDAGMILLQDTSTYRWVRNNWVYSDNNMETRITQVFGRSGGSQAINAPLVKEGDTTNTTVGQVLRTGITVQSSDGATLTNATEASVCAEPGDSGGSVRWGNVAHGVVSLSALTPDRRCLAAPRMYFNIASDIEAAVAARIYES